jgi:hypothetical protein
MQTRREYLVGLGLAKEGRGKFSTAAKEALDKAIAEGVVFADTVAPTEKSVPAKPTGNSEKTEVVGKTAPPVFTPYLSPSEFRFPEAEYVAVDASGKKYGMRECCNLCRVSLTNHMCETPSILGNIAVTIRRR